MWNKKGFCVPQIPLSWCPDGAFRRRRRNPCRAWIHPPRAHSNWVHPFFRHDTPRAQSHSTSWADRTSTGRHENWSIPIPAGAGRKIPLRQLCHTVYSTPNRFICAGVEQTAKNGGHNVTVLFSPGRTDASPEQTDVDAFAVLEPAADGFRNYQKKKYAVSAEELLVVPIHEFRLASTGHPSQRKA